VKLLTENKIKIGEYKYGRKGGTYWFI